MIARPSIPLCDRFRTLFAALGLAAAAGVQAQGTPPPLPASVPVVEYYNATLDAYFITGRATEQAALEALASDFRRTGMQFTAAAAAPAAGAERICRYFVSLDSVPGPFTRSHFYGREALECAAIRAQAPAGFTDEGYDFTVTVPHLTPGSGLASCPASAPLRIFRLFRPAANGRTGNHRYVASLASYEAMQAAGWSGEGVSFCVAAAVDLAAPPESGFQRVLTGGTALLSPFPGGCSNGQTGTPYLGGEIEPTLAMNPANPRHLVAAWQQDRWSNGGARGTASAVSFDGGNRWTASQAAFSRCGGGVFERATDPWVSVASDGVAYQMALGFSGASFSASSDSAMLVTRSTDGGLNWSAPTTLIRDVGAAYFNDKNMLTVDPRDSRYVYAVWGRLSGNGSGPAYFARSIDGGASWEAARSIYDPGTTNQTFGNLLLVLGDGSVLNFFSDIIRAATASSDKGAWLRVIRSTDRGVSWSAPVTIASDLGVGVTSAAGRIRDSKGLVSAAVAPDGDIHLVWQDARFAQGAYDGIALASSKDGGATWSAPARINARGDVPAFGPTVAVRPDGTLGVSYFDLRNASSSAPLVSNYRLATSSDGKYWRESGIESAFDMTQAPFANGWFIGDYHGLVGRGNSFGALYARVTGDATNLTDIVFANIAEGSLKSGGLRDASMAQTGEHAPTARLREAALAAADRAARARLPMRLAAQQDAEARPNRE